MNVAVYCDKKSIGQQIMEQIQQLPLETKINAAFYDRIDQLLAAIKQLHVVIIGRRMAHAEALCRINPALMLIYPACALGLDVAGYPPLKPVAYHIAEDYLDLTENSLQSVLQKCLAHHHGLPAGSGAQASPTQENAASEQTRPTAPNDTLDRVVIPPTIRDTLQKPTPAPEEHGALEITRTMDNIPPTWRMRQ